MNKPCRLELRTTGSWKPIVSFDAADDERTDDIMNAAAQLADIVNDGAAKPLMALRIVAVGECADVLMEHNSRECGWRDVRTGEPA